jgi:hexosaminidase
MARFPGVLPAALLLIGIAAQAAGLDLMPLPASVTVRPGELTIDSSFRIATRGPSDARVEAATQRFLERLGRISGVSLDRTAGNGAATLLVEWKENAPTVPRENQDESYALEVDAAQARLRAPTSVGILRGLETLLQSVETRSNGASIPALVIRDEPRFRWRGVLLDSSRHFLPVESVKRTLDGMAAFKFNVLHWHLSDDQGFRLESKRFPKLHGAGSDGLFYTQAEIREIVAFAADRGIRVVPEFDMPGHATSWFVGYPELASAPGPYVVQREAGLFEPTMDPSRPEIYTFLDGFFSEIADLFPDAYVHIGGDEVDAAQWKRSESIQAFMKTENLATTDQLQAYFNHRLHALLAKHGKKMIGWDEVLAPGLPSDVTVQSWRGLSALAQTVRSGHEGILSFGYYLDQLQPAAEHYSIDPFDGEVRAVTPAERGRILGGEACLWTEHISPENLDLRLWPRAAVVAERLWSPQQDRDVSSMYARLPAALRHLKTVGIDPELTRRQLLEHLSDAASVESLSILLETLKPVRAANRAAATEIRPTGNFNRLVDAADPDSGARQMDRQEVRTQLARWNKNAVTVKAVLEKYENLREAIPLADNVRDLSAASLEALYYLDRRQKPPRAWSLKQRQLLERASIPRADLSVTLVDTLRTLLAAAGR